MRIPPPLPVIVFMTAWLIFVGSFFLPTTDILQMPDAPPNTPLTGWQASWTSLVMFGHPATIVLIPEEPGILLLLAFPLLNFVALVAPLVALGWKEGAWTLGGFFLIFGVLPWLLPTGILGNLFVGFYVWDASFFLMGAGCALISVACRQAYQERIQRFRQRVA